jgi:hypothetical protein
MREKCQVLRLDTNGAETPADVDAGLYTIEKETLSALLRKKNMPEEA